MIGDISKSCGHRLTGLVNDESARTQKMAIQTLDCLFKNSRLGLVFNAFLIQRLHIKDNFSDKHRYCQKDHAIVKEKFSLLHPRIDFANLSFDLQKEK